MKLISFTKSNWKFLLYSLVYLIIMLLLNFMSIYLQDYSENMQKITKKIPLMLLINHFFLIFCIISKIIRDLKRKKKKAEENEIQKKFNSRISPGQVELIYNAPEDNMNLTNKTVIVYLSMIILDYLYNASLMYYQKKYEENTDLVFSQFYKFMDVLFLLLFFRLVNKIRFYKHQYISLAIIIISGLINYFSKIYFEEKFNIEIHNKFSPISIIFLVVCPFIDSIKIYYFKDFMTYKFFSPLNISYFLGFAYLVISAILITIFFFINSEVSDIKKYLSIRDLEFPKGLEIVILIGYSLLYSFEYAMDLIIINRFTPFHLILLVIFGELMTDYFYYFRKTVDFKTVEFAIHATLYAFAIIGILIFIETIILGCCGLDEFTRNNIIFRGEEEVEKLEKGERTSSQDEMVEDIDNNIH